MPLAPLTAVGGPLVIIGFVDRDNALLAASVINHHNHNQRASPIDDQQQLLYTSSLQACFLDHLGRFENVVELGESAVDEAKRRLGTVPVVVRVVVAEYRCLPT